MRELLFTNKKKSIQSSDYISKKEVQHNSCISMIRRCESSTKFVNKDENVILNLNYSSEESFTGMYWIDGKKIYRKYIIFKISSSSYDYTHNLNVVYM